MKLYYFTNLGIYAVYYMAIGWLQAFLYMPGPETMRGVEAPPPRGRQGQETAVPACRIVNSSLLIASHAQHTPLGIYCNALHNTEFVYTALHQNTCKVSLLFSVYMQYLPGI